MEYATYIILLEFNSYNTTQGDFTSNMIDYESQTNLIKKCRRYSELYDRNIYNFMSEFVNLRKIIGI